MVKTVGRSAYRWGVAGLTALLGWAADARGGYESSATNPTGVSGSTGVIQPDILIDPGIGGQLLAEPVTAEPSTGVAVTEPVYSMSAAKSADQSGQVTGASGLQPRAPLGGGIIHAAPTAVFILRPPPSAPTFITSGGGGTAGVTGSIVANPAPPGVLLALSGLPVLAVGMLRRRAGQSGLPA